MSNVDELFKQLILLVLAILFVKFVLSEMNRPKDGNKYIAEQAKKKREAKQKAADDINNEIEFLNRLKLLPSTDEALKLLLEEYNWIVLLGTMNLGKTHVELIQEIDANEGDVIELPNMQASYYGKNEKEVLGSVVQDHTVRYGDLYDDEQTLQEEISFHGIDSLSQKPTVSTLMDLSKNGCVTVTEPFSNDRRIYTCSVTDAGQSLLLKNTLYDANALSPNKKIGLLSAEARNKTGLLMQSIIGVA